MSHCMSPSCRSIMFHHAYKAWHHNLSTVYQQLVAAKLRRSTKSSQFHMPQKNESLPQSAKQVAKVILFRIFECIWCERRSAVDPVYWAVATEQQKSAATLELPDAFAKWIDHIISYSIISFTILQDITSVLHCIAVEIQMYYNCTAIKCSSPPKIYRLLVAHVSHF